MKVERIICPVCKSEKRITSEEDNLSEYTEEVVPRTCEKPECQNNPADRLLRAIFGERKKEVNNGRPE